LKAVKRISLEISSRTFWAERQRSRC